MSKLLSQAHIGSVTLGNRIIRSATYEGLSDSQGFPTQGYADFYNDLAKNNIGAIITGFTYISKCGRAMQEKQAGIDDDAKIVAFKTVTDQVHAHGSKLFMQIAHCGRQTVSSVLGGKVKGASAKKSNYFRSAPGVLTTQEVFSLAERFASAALRGKKCGFDGVQIHAAHGYLVHQFILPSINDRTDIFAIEKKTGIGTYFLEVIIDAIRKLCGSDFPLLVKISGSDDYRKRFKLENYVQLIRFLDSKRVDAIEISYGTMDHAFSIIRGRSVPLDLIVKYNPRYRAHSLLDRVLKKRVLYPFLKPRLKIFSPMYNLPFAKMAKQYTKIPIISVGGFRKKQEMIDAIERNETDFVSLCRPFICEPDLVVKLTSNDHYVSKCLDCNMCAVMCDSAMPTRCYYGKAS